MNDRELLEMAAKAAGIELQPMEVKNVSHIGDDRFIGYMVSADKWPRGWFNPLTDDGDALRLAVKLRINLWIEKTIVIAEVCSDDEGPNIIAKELDSSEVATRRAIVRAAAEIGRGME